MITNLIGFWQHYQGMRSAFLQPASFPFTNPQPTNPLLGNTTGGMAAPQLLIRFRWLVYIVRPAELRECGYYARLAPN